MDLWESYKSSVFICYQPLGDAINFAIISAQNPAGAVQHPQHNLRLDCELETHLDLYQLPYRALLGCSPDLSFQEKSWAVLCEKSRALELARQFQQNAIYWVEAGQLYLVPALWRGEEEYLGLYQQRQIVLAD